MTFESIVLLFTLLIFVFVIGFTFEVLQTRSKKKNDVEENFVPLVVMGGAAIYAGTRRRKRKPRHTPTSAYELSEISTEEIIPVNMISDVPYIKNDYVIKPFDDVNLESIKDDDSHIEINASKININNDVYFKDNVEISDEADEVKFTNKTLFNNDIYLLNNHSISLNSNTQINKENMNKINENTENILKKYTDANHQGTWEDNTDSNEMKYKVLNLKTRYDDPINKPNEDTTKCKKAFWEMLRDNKPFLSNDDIQVCCNSSEVNVNDKEHYCYAEIYNSGNHNNNYDDKMKLEVDSFRKEMIANYEDGDDKYNYIYLSRSRPDTKCKLYMFRHDTDASNFKEGEEDKYDIKQILSDDDFDVNGKVHKMKDIKYTDSIRLNMLN